MITALLIVIPLLVGLIGGQWFKRAMARMAPLATPIPIETALSARTKQPDERELERPAELQRVA